MGTDQRRQAERGDTVSEALEIGHLDRLKLRFEKYFGCAIEYRMNLETSKVAPSRLDGGAFTVEQLNWMQGFLAGYAEAANPVDLNKVEPEQSPMLGLSREDRTFAEVMALRLRYAIEKAGVSNRDVAQACLVTDSAVSEWKRTGRIAKKHLKAIAKLTNTSLEWWLDAGGFAQASPSAPTTLTEHQRKGRGKRAR